MHSGLSSTVSVISMVTASSIMGQFAFLRMFADGMASKALRGDFAGQIIMIPARCSLSLGWGLGGKKKSHPEQLEHSQARVVR